MWYVLVAILSFLLIFTFLNEGQDGGNDQKKFHSPLCALSRPPLCGTEDLTLTADLGPPGLEHPAMDGLRTEVSELM